jgi:molecular chaperone DnaK
VTTIIGIDLGTSNSCAAVMLRGHPQIIPNGLGSRLTPSAVRILEGGEAIVGDPAIQSQFLDSANTVTGVKRLIGRRYNEVVDLVPSFTYQVFPGENNLATIRIREKSYTPQFISAFILKSLKQDAERFLNMSISEVVITVPAYFNDTQRQATTQAANIAGLSVKRIINEPTAACLARSLDMLHDEVVAVFDLGGGTFDISIMEVGEGVQQVMSTGGDGFLGGDDFDERVAEWLAEEFFIVTGLDVTTDQSAMQRIRSAAIRAKHDLSQREEVPIHIPFLAAKNGVPLDLALTLTRSGFQNVCDELFQRLREPCSRALADANVKPEAVDSVLLVGGATRMPGINEIIRSVFKRLPVRSLNPDEAVAMGAAVQAGVLSGLIDDLLLLDVTSSSLGVEQADGTVRTMIRRNTLIPTKKTELFSTATDNQSSVEINIVQGEHTLAESNRSLGRLIIEGISLAPKHEPRLDVTFDIDAAGILTVSAKNIVTGQVVKRSTFSLTGMSEETAQKLAKEMSSLSLR